MKSAIAASLAALPLVALLACGGGGVGKGVRQDVTATMGSAEPQLERCYASALERDREVRARIILDLTIKAKTGAFVPEVASNSSGDGELASCVLGVVSELKLPDPQDAHIATSYPLEFQPE